MGQVRWYERLLSLDRRWIFLAIAVAVVVPFFRPMGLPVFTTDPVERLYRAVDELAPDSRPLLLSIDYAPATLPELEPMSYAILRHALGKGVNVAVMTLHPAGYGLAQRAIETVAEEMGAEYGKDYCFLGFSPGVSAPILGIGVDIRDVFPKDAYGTPLNELPMMEGIGNYDDIPLVITIAGWSAAEAWIYYAYQPFHQKVGAGVTAVMATDYYPYLQSRQLEGLLGGMRGAAEYEKLVGRPDKGTRGMDSQSVIHVLIIVLVLLGNLAYFARQRGERAARAKG